MDIFRDPRIRSIHWHDLTHLTTFEIVKELLLPLPWLALSIYLAHRNLYPLAFGASFVFFLTGLRIVHNAYHYLLGISRTATEWVMLVMSILMLGSMHAVQFNHLEHHKDCLGDDDIEGLSARMSGWLALAVGPMFPLRMHLKAVQFAKPNQRKWIQAEIFGNLIWGCFIFGILNAPSLKYHFLAMALGQCLTSFFAVWTVHHDCDRSHFLARTLRHKLKNTISFNMFFHIEHHLFPKVPTCHLPALAGRLDEAAPDLQKKLVF